jgi:hypothetical protein
MKQGITYMCIEIWPHWRELGKTLFLLLLQSSYMGLWFKANKFYWRILSLPPGKLVGECQRVSRARFDFWRPESIQQEIWDEIWGSGYANSLTKRGLIHILPTLWRSHLRSEIVLKTPREDVPATTKYITASGKTGPKVVAICGRSHISSITARRDRRLIGVAQ